MNLLKPEWNQEKPTCEEARVMCNEVVLKPMEVGSEVIARTLERLRATHSNGGAFLAALHVDDNSAFEWFASRNRLLEYDVLPMLLRRAEVRALLPELEIPAERPVHSSTNACTITSSNGFTFDNPFLLDGQLAQNLIGGGAYGPSVSIDGRTAKRLAMDFCEAAFNQRYEEVSLFSSYEAWTPWFRGIAWDWTAVLFDRRERALWILAVTDED